MINADVSVKNNIYVKENMLGILPHATVKMENTQQVLWIIEPLSVMKLQSHMSKNKKHSNKL